MRVVITAVGAYVSPGAGEVHGFVARELVPERKHLKLMPRSVRLGVAAVRAALDARPGWQDVPPPRRGLFVGTSPAISDADALRAALDAASLDGELDVGRFGEVGVPLVPPLWLVQGLSNNVLGFSSAYHDLRGANTTRCDGRIAGLAAVIDGARAVAEARVDLAVAGGHDSLLHAAAWTPRPVGEAAVFFVIERDVPGSLVGDVGVRLDAPAPAEAAVEYGAAAGLVALRDALGGGGRVEVRDPSGAVAWLEVQRAARATS